MRLAYFTAMDASPYTGNESVDQMDKLVLIQVVRSSMARTGDCGLGIMN